MSNQENAGYSMPPECVSIGSLIVSMQRPTKMDAQTSPDLYLEDFAPGMVYQTLSADVSEADIIEFAAKFDPQYFHLDPKAARKSQFGGLIASGFHTLSLSFRQFFDLNLWPNAIVASPGMSNVKWWRPMRPGDRIISKAEVTEVRPSKSRPDRGTVVMRHSAWNQNGDEIMSVICAHILTRRSPPGD